MFIGNIEIKNIYIQQILELKAEVLSSILNSTKLIAKSFTFNDDVYLNIIGTDFVMRGKNLDDAKYNLSKFLLTYATQCATYDYKLDDNMAYIIKILLLNSIESIKNDIELQPNQYICDITDWKSESRYIRSYISVDAYNKDDAINKAKNLYLKEICTTEPGDMDINIHEIQDTKILQVTTEEDEYL